MVGERPSVTILTEYFYPEQASTAQLLTDLADGFSEMFETEVITMLPNYHQSDRSRSVPRQERRDGVSIRRLRATRFDKERIPLRVINWMTFTVLAALSLLRRSTDIVLVLSNPPILPFAAWLRKRLRGTPYVYLIHDVYPDMPIGLGVLDEESIVARLWERAIRVVYRDADRIVVLGDSMERRLTEKMVDDPQFDPDKIEVIPNWEDGEFIEPMDKADNEFAAEHDTREQFTLVYSGNIGRYHDVGTAIDAFATLEDRNRDDIQLLVIGEGGRKEQYQRRARDLESVRFLPFQPKDRLPESLTCGDASLVAIDSSMEGMCVSSKLYSALASGQPVLAQVAGGDEVARVVETFDCGVQVDEGNADELADVLEVWADDGKRVAEMGANARKAFENNYTKEHAIEAYLELFSQMAREKSA